MLLYVTGDRPLRAFSLRPGSQTHPVGRYRPTQRYRRNDTRPLRRSSGGGYYILHQKAPACNYQWDLLAQLCPTMYNLSEPYRCGRNGKQSL